MHQSYRLVSSTIENYRTKTLVLDQSMTAQPGQFVMVWLPGVGEKPYCVTNDDPLTLTVVSVGSFSTALNAIAAGEKIWIRGPFGHGYQLKGEKILLAGGGYGVASLLFLASQALSRNYQIDVCIGAGAAQDVILYDAFRNAGINVQVSSEDGSSGKKGLVTELVSEFINAAKPDWIYACGPTNMLKAVSNLCQSHRISHQLSWEAHIRCGLGMCGHCEGTDLEPFVPPGWLVCQDGPVQIVELSE